MGNSSNSHYQVRQPLGSEWVELGATTYCKLLRNLETGKEAEQYTVTPIDDPDHDIDLYQFRKHQKLGLVSTLAVEILKPQGLCNDVAKLLVTNERIPQRLSEVGRLPFQEGVSVLYWSLMGFSAIYQQVGYVEVNEQMVGFTPQNNVKVWMSENFSQNHPNDQQEDGNHSEAASTMMEEILGMVQGHSSKPFDQLASQLRLTISANPTFPSLMSRLQELIRIRGINLPIKLSLLQGKLPKMDDTMRMPTEASKQPDTGAVLKSSVFPINLNNPEIVQSSSHQNQKQPRTRILVLPNSNSTLGIHPSRAHSVLKNVESMLSPFKSGIQHVGSVWPNSNYKVGLQIPKAHMIRKLPTPLNAVGHAHFQKQSPIPVYFRDTVLCPTAIPDNLGFASRIQNRCDSISKSLPRQPITALQRMTSAHTLNTKPQLKNSILQRVDSMIILAKSRQPQEICQVSGQSGVTISNSGIASLSTSGTQQSPFIPTIPLNVLDRQCQWMSQSKDFLPDFNRSFQNVNADGVLEQSHNRSRQSGYRESQFNSVTGTSFSSKFRTPSKDSKYESKAIAINHVQAARVLHSYASFASYHSRTSQTSLVGRSPPTKYHCQLPIQRNRYVGVEKYQTRAQKHL